jgi:hypothetical protein
MKAFEIKSASDIVFSDVRSLFVLGFTARRTRDLVRLRP